MTDVTPSAIVGKSQKWALIALFVGAISIGSSPIFVRLSEVGPMATAFWRVGLALIPFVIWFGGSGASSAGGRPRQLKDHLLLASPGVFLAIDLIFWHLALHHTSVANATLLSNMAPIFVTLGSWLLFRSRITPTFLTGLALAIAGVIILKGGPLALGDGDLFGDSLALTAAVFYAGYIMMVGRLRSRFSTVVIMLWSTAAAAVTTLPAALIMEPVLFPWTLFGWLVVIGLAWLTHAAGQGMIAFALAWLPPAFSSLTLLVQPVVASLLAWVILSEPLGMTQAIGGAIVLFGILVARRG
ncbi:MAG: DMT family transporter [Phyllobacterium sp.]